MDKFTFDFNGRNSAEFGIYATSYDIVMPFKREKRRQIPFRHGTHLHDNTFFNDRQLRLRCFWLNDKEDNISRDEFREITLWLSERGRIVLDVEPDKHYVGELFDPSDLRAHYNRSTFGEIRSTDGTFELVFTCEPFAYGEQVVMPISHGNNEIEYRGTAETPTLIILRNTGTAPISTVVLTATSTTGG